MERASAEVVTDRHGKYHPIAELGQGGTATVYLAVARGPDAFNKLVVLKVLRPELTDEPEFRQMFMSEARLSARLNHPNVVQTNEILQINGRPIIVMEYLEGQSLSRIIARSRDSERRGELPLSMHLRILVDVLSGLHYSHELTDYDGTPLCVVHRDMSPQNVFVSYDGRVCVLDFGIAKLTGAAHDMQTGVGVVKGKLRYMPPEQLLAGAVDRRADIFAVGVMLWEAITGDKMWRGLSDGVIMNHVIQGQIPQPSSINPHVPWEIERICMKALAHDRDARYATAAELQADLEAFLANDTSTTNRAIGKQVNELFADERAQMRGLIERQLSSLSAQPPSLVGIQDMHLPAAHAQPQAHSGPVSTQYTRDLRPRRSESRRRSVLSPLLGAVVLTAALLVAWQFLKPEELAAPEGLKQQERAAAAAPAPASAAIAPMGAAAEQPAATKPAVAAAPEQVTLRVSVLPASAQLYLDDEPLPSNPYTIRASRDDIKHTIRAEADGFVALTRTVTLVEDSSVELTLEPERAKSLRRAKKRRVSSEPREVREVQAPAASSADKPAAPCAVPYYLDERGIRRIKRECL